MHIQSTSTKNQKAAMSPSRVKDLDLEIGDKHYGNKIGFRSDLRYHEMNDHIQDHQKGIRKNTTRSTMGDPRVSAFQEGQRLHEMHYTRGGRFERNCSLSCS